MKRIAFLLATLVAICVLHCEVSFAVSNQDARTCKKNLDGDRGKVAAMSDSAKKAEANDHLKTAYEDLKEEKYTDCLSELKAAEALAQ